MFKFNYIDPEGDRARVGRWLRKLPAKTAARILARHGAKSLAGLDPSRFVSVVNAVRRAMEASRIAAGARAQFTAPIAAAVSKGVQDGRKAAVGAVRQEEARRAERAAAERERYAAERKAEHERYEWRYLARERLSWNLPGLKCRITRDGITIEGIREPLNWGVIRELEAERRELFDCPDDWTDGDWYRATLDLAKEDASAARPVVTDRRRIECHPDYAGVQVATRDRCIRLPWDILKSAARIGRDLKWSGDDDDD